MGKKENREEKIQQLMKSLELSREDAEKLLEEDEIIDGGGKCEWEQEPTAEQKKVMRQARMADREVKAEKTKRTRAEDPDKRALMLTLMNAVAEVADGGIVLKNPEREFEFNFNGRKFKITLSAPREKKAE